MTTHAPMASPTQSQLTLDARSVIQGGLTGSNSISVNQAGVLAFVTAFVILAMQVLVARIVSAKLLNNYAFFVISLTMLGFAFSGVVLSRWLPRLVARCNESVNWCSALFVISTLAVTVLFYHAGLGSQKFVTRSEFITSFLSLMPIAVLYAIPFAFSGFILGMLLAMPELPTRRIYCFDLVGSSFGALCVLPAISGLGVENSLLGACVIQWAASLLLMPPRGRGARWLMGVALIGMIFAGVYGRSLFKMCHRDDSILSAAQKPGSGFVLEHTAWDPVARIEVTSIPPPEPDHMAFPVVIGDNRAFLSRFKKVITQNNFAFTYAVSYDGNRQSLEGIDQTLYAAAYQATSTPKPRVAIVGVGGGFDVLTALYFNAADVTAVEINAATMKILKETYRDYFKSWVEDPRVHLVQAEGRHYLSSHPEKFDVVQLSGVDSYSGTPGAANIFSENYLYTAEAFDLYLSRLSDNGIINMMRLEHRPPREMLRALTTAVGALRRAGVSSPAKQIIMLTAKSGNFTSMLVKKTPFSEVEEQQVAKWSSTNKFFSMSAAPRWDAPEKNFYQHFLALNDPGAEQAYFDRCPFNVTPAMDDKPFFFRFSYWSHLWPQSLLIDSSVPALEISLIILGLFIGIAALVCIWLPLRLVGQAKGKQVVHWRYGLIFASTAIGYMAIEIALLQKFSLFLGHPNYALSVVLASLLLATGIGSLFSETIVRKLNSIRMVSCALAMGIILEYLLVLPHLTAWVVLPFAARAGLVSVLVLPLGILMGSFVPTALESLKNSGNSRSVPWAWGINGIFSVLAPVSSIALSVTGGISLLLLSAIPIYLLAGFVFPVDNKVSPPSDPANR
jgi:spermidine synthase